MTMIELAQAINLKRLAGKELSPAGVHFKNSPIKAFYYANFYKPKVQDFDRFVTVESVDNAKLHEKVNPFISIIANYAKANNKRINVYCTKFKDADFLQFKFVTVDKKGKNTFPASTIGTLVESDKSKASISQDISKLLNRMIVPEQQKPFLISSKIEQFPIENITGK